MLNIGILDFYPARWAVVDSTESLKTFEKGGYVCSHIKKASGKKKVSGNSVKDGNQS